MADPKNTVGEEDDYKVYTSAYFALNLVNNENIQDFSIQTNVDDFENFGDIVIDILFQNGTLKNYAIQLRHKINTSEKLVPSNFEPDEKFYFEKYLKKFKKLTEEKRRQYYFILYTNLKLNAEAKNKAKNFNILEKNDCEERIFFDTTSSDVSSDFYKFEANDFTPNKEDYENFFSKFTLYTNQDNADNIKQKIDAFFHFEKNQTISYIELFQKWHQNKFSNKKIDRDTVSFHLTNILLSKGIITNYFPNVGNLKLFEEAVRLFNVTIIKDTASSFLKNINNTFFFEDYLPQIKQYLERFNISNKNLNSEEEIKKAKEECLMLLAKKFKIVDKYVLTLEKDIENKIFTYFFKKILIIDSEHMSHECILQVAQIYRNQNEEKKIRLIVLAASFDITSLHCPVFQNLKDLRTKSEDLYCKITAFKVSLQGREDISLYKVISTFEEILPFIETKEIFNILKNDYFLIGENRQLLPEIYINRKVLMTVLDFATVLKCIEDEEDIVIINFQNENKRRFVQNGISIINSNNKSTFDIEHLSLISTNEENSNRVFENITKQEPYKRVHYLRKVKENFFLVRSTNNFFFSNHNLLKETLWEKDIHTILNCPLNIIIAKSGMGKTTILNYLKNNYPNNYWTIRIGLKSHNLFLKAEHSFEDILKHFIGNKEDRTFLKKLKELFLKQKQIVFFFDDLDQLQTDSLENVLKHINELLQKGFRVWIASTENLRSRLDSIFNTFVIEVVEADQEEYKEFIQNRLKDKYNKDEIEVLKNKIFGSTQISKNQEFLGMPMQLYIVTQIFLDKKINVEDFEESNFVLTKIFQMFFQGRYDQLINKLKLENAVPILKKFEDCLEDYELIALQTVFDSDISNNLDLNLRRSNRFLKEVEKEGDPLGIIVKVENKNALFKHHIYANYFVCLYLRNNFQKAKLLKKQLFSDEFKNLMLLLSMMLAEDNPLHLAVIYKDIPEIHNHIEDEANYYDLAGRNLLQVAVSLANSNFETNRGDFWNCFDKSEESIENKQIMKILISKCNPYEKDLLFGITTFHYAILRNNLFALELILEHFGMTHEAFILLQEYNYINNEIIACFSMQWNYHNLLSVALEKKNALFLRDQEFPLYEKVRLFGSSAKPYVIKLLIHFGANIYLDLLNRAVEEDNCELVKYLLTYFENDYKKVRLTEIAVTSKSWNVVKLFIEKQWDFNLKFSERPLVYYVIEDGQFEISDFIIQKYPNLDLNCLIPLLYNAIKYKNLEIINYLLNLGINVNIKNEKNQNLLYLAVKSNYTEAVKLLVEKGAEVTEDKKDTTSIELATLNGNIEIVRLLPVNNKKNCSGDTLLHLASDGGNMEVVSYIFNKIKKVNDTNNKGWTPIFYAASQRHFEVFNFLINCGANIDGVTTDGETLLHWAAWGGCCKIINYLLDKGLEKDAKDNAEKTPLFFAAENEKLNAIQFLINKEAEINSSKEILLQCAIKNKQIDLIELLLKHRIDLNKILITNTCFNDQELEVTPLSLSIRWDSFEVTKCLIKHGANVNDIKAFSEAATKKEDTRFLNLLFNKGYQLNTYTSENTKLFDSLVADNNFESINVLLLNNFQVNIETIFFKAIHSEEVRTVQLCIEKGANVNATNANGETILLQLFKELRGSLYRNKKILEITKLLIRGGAEVNCISKSRECIWFYIDWQDEELIDLLLSKNVDADLEDLYGNTALYHAVVDNNQKAIHVLSLNFKKYNLNTLLRAVETSNISLIKRFLQKGFQPQIIEDESTIMPRVGASTKNIELVKLLLSSGLNINASTECKVTALYWALMNNNIDTAKFLISKNADVNCIDADGGTIWEYLDWNDKSLINLVMSKNVDPELENHNGLTPLFYAIYFNEMNFVTSLLLSYGVDLANEPKLIGCIQIKNLEVCNLLEKKGLVKTSNALKKFGEDYYSDTNFALVTVEDLYQKLHLAVYLGNVTNVEEVIQESIDYESVDKYNSICPLHFAVKNGILDLDLLIEKTKWIRSIYEEKVIWTIEDMRKHLLQIFSLNFGFCKRQFLHTYFSQEVYDNFFKNECIKM